MNEYMDVERKLVLNSIEEGDLFILPNAYNWTSSPMKKSFIRWWFNYKMRYNGNKRTPMHVKIKHNAAEPLFIVEEYEQWASINDNHYKPNSSGNLFPVDWFYYEGAYDGDLRGCDYYPGDIIKLHNLEENTKYITVPCLDIQEVVMNSLSKSDILSINYHNKYANWIVLDVRVEYANGDQVEIDDLESADKLKVYKYTIAEYDEKEPYKGGQVWDEIVYGMIRGKILLDEKGNEIIRSSYLDRNPEDFEEPKKIILEVKKKKDMLKLNFY